MNIYINIYIYKYKYKLLSKANFDLRYKSNLKQEHFESIEFIIITSRIKEVLPSSPHCLDIVSNFNATIIFLFLFFLLFLGQLHILLFLFLLFCCF